MENVLKMEEEMDELERLSRKRPKMLFNLLPPEVAADNPQTLIFPVFHHYYDRDQYSLKKFDNDFIDPKKKKLLLRATNFLKRGKSLKQSPEDEMLFGKGKKSQPCKFVAFQNAALYNNGCITCGKQNIEVPYFGERHLCLFCREQVQTYREDPAKVFLDRKGNIVCLGQYEDKNTGEQKFYKVSYDKLKIFEYRCYATLADNNQLIILLHDQQDLLKSTYKRKTIRQKSKLPKNYVPIQDRPLLRNSSIMKSMSSFSSLPQVGSNRKKDFINENQIDKKLKGKKNQMAGSRKSSKAFSRKDSSKRVDTNNSNLPKWTSNSFEEEDQEKVEKEKLARYANFFK